MQNPTETYDLEVSSTPAPASSNKQFEEVLIQNKKIYNCLIPGCGKTFKFKSEMKRHLTIHSNDRPYTCSFPDCGKTFKRADALSNHFRIHSRSTPFNCPVPECMSQFTTKSALRYHLLKHTGEKIFKCDHEGCDQAFITYAQLKQHEKTSYYHHKSQDPNKISNAFEFEHSDASHDDLNFRFDEEEGLPDFDNSDNFGTKFEDMLNQPKLDISEKLKAFKSWNSVSDNFPFGLSSTESSDFSSVSKSDKKVESTLMDMLEIMMKENQQLKKKLKYTSDLLQNNTQSVMEKAFPIDDDQINVDLFFKTQDQDDEWGERNFGF